MPRVAVVGSYGVGLTVRCTVAPRAGETVLAHSWATAHGGKGSNQAIAARRLGAEVDFLTSIGPDQYGEQAQKLWAEEGVRAVTRDAHAPTMTGVILVEDTGENRIVIAPGALKELTDSDVADFADVVAQADVLVTGLEIPLATATAALLMARAHHVPTILNPAPARRLPAAMWPLVDVVVPNHGEAAILVGTPGTAHPTMTPRELATALLARGAKAAVITLGAAGAYWSEAAGSGLAAAPTLPAVVDTTGAGDAFVAALAVAMAEGAALPESVSFAVTAGAYAVTRPDVLPGLATRDELIAFAASNPPHHIHRGFVPSHSEGFPA